MESMLRILVIVVGIFLGIFLLYSKKTLKRYKGVTIEVSVPQPYRTIYRFCRDRPFLGRELTRVRNNLNLIYNSDTYSKILTAMMFTVYPIVFVFEFLVIGSLCDIWYFTLILGIFFCIISYFEVSNRIEGKAMSLKYLSVNIYESAERRYSNGDRTVDVFNQISSISSGFIRRITSNFANKVGIDAEDAYNYFIDCIGDQFAEAFIRTIASYDIDGKDPCQDILNTIKLSKRHYYIERRTHAKVKGFKKLAIMVLCICLVCAKLSISILYTLGGTFTLRWLVPVTILIILVCYTMALSYERY